WLLRAVYLSEDSAAQRKALKVGVDLGKGIRIRVTLCHAEPNPAHGDLNLRADLQQLQPNRIALGAGQSRSVQSEPAQILHQDVGHRGEVEPELIGTHRGRTGSVGEQTPLLFLDPVLHVATSAVGVLVDVARSQPARRHRRYNETWIGSFSQMFGFGDNAAFPAPTVLGGVLKL